MNIFIIKNKIMKIFKNRAYFSDLKKEIIVYVKRVTDFDFCKFPYNLF